MVNFGVGSGTGEADTVVLVAPANASTGIIGVGILRAGRGWDWGLRFGDVRREKQLLQLTTEEGSLGRAFVQTGRQETQGQAPSIVVMFERSKGWPLPS